MSWSKNKNFTGNIYVFEGCVRIDTEYYLHYFLSNKRSYISINKDTQDTHDTQDKDNQKQDKKDKEKETYDNLQILSLYVDKFFKKYNIDEFINNIMNNTSNN